MSVSKKLQSLGFLPVALGFSFILILPYVHGHWRLADDGYQIMLPLWRLQERALRMGEWILWNPSEGLGKPLALNSGGGLYFPLQILWGQIVGWSELSYLYFIGLLIFLGALCAFEFGLTVGLGSCASAFFALAFAGNGYVLGYFSNPTLMIPFLLWPLLGVGLVRLASEDPRKRSGAVRTIAIALVLIETGGYPLTKLLIYGATAIGYLALSRRSPQPFWRINGFWEILSASVLAVLCTSPAWLTQFEALAVSERMGADIYKDYTYGAPSNFLSLATAILPAQFLRRDALQLGMGWLERSWWMGSLTVGLVLFGLWRGAFPFRRFRTLAILSLLAFLFSLGGHSFLRELSAVGLPLLEYLRFSNNARLICMAFLMFVGASVFSQLTKEPEIPDVLQQHSARQHVVWVWLFFLTGCVAAAVSVSPSTASSDQLYAAPDLGWKLGLLHTSFYLALAYSVYALRTVGSGPWGWAGLIVALQFLSLADGGYAFRRLIAAETDQPARGYERFTLLSPQPNVRSLRGWFDGSDWISWDGNLKVLNAYNPPYHTWLWPTSVAPEYAPYVGSLASCQTPSQEELPSRQGISEQLSCEGMQFKIDRWFGNRLEISGSNPAPALLVVHDFVDPHWVAFVNGKAVPIKTYLARFKAIEVPPGSWTATFEYRHSLFPWVWLLSGLSFVAIVLWPLRRRSLALVTPLSQAV